MIRQFRKKLFVALPLCWLAGCAMFAAYNALSPEEKAYYQSVADQMTTTQKMHYLELKAAQERQAYLKGLNLQEPTASGHGQSSVEHASVEKTPPAMKPQKKLVEENIPAEEPPPKPAKITPPKPEPVEAPKKAVAVSEPAPPSSNLPRVKYAKTGDPITDVLILLDLYEKGKITKAQFEHEKELALQKAP